MAARFCESRLASGALAAETPAIVVIIRTLVTTRVRIHSIGVPYGNRLPTCRITILPDLRTKVMRGIEDFQRHIGHDDRVEVNPRPAGSGRADRITWRALRDQPFYETSPGTASGT